jgi:DNA-binding MarR family transcriptional regulator
MWFFLRLLWEQDGRIQRNLGQDTDLQPSTVVNAVDNLVRLKLIYRRRNKEDRRKINVLLTAEGRALKDVLTPYAIEINSIATSTLSDREKVALWKLLKKVQAALVEDHRLVTK